MIIKGLWKKTMNKVYNFFRVGIMAGVGYESTPDGWKYLKIGQRMSAVLDYHTALGASSSYTSSGIPVQDSAGNNFTEIRVSLYQEGSTNTTVKIQQSSDNSTWRDLPNQSANLTANGAVVLKCDVFRGYIRVVESNDDSSNAQTTNDLHVEVL